MDTVRFGRVLGMGARQAAKTLVTAADAARAPHPSARRTPAPVAAARAPQASAGQTSASRTPQTSSSATLQSRGQSVAAAAQQARATGQGLAEGSRRFGRAVWAPAVRLSGVLWLELTGVFFGLFALVAGVAAWRLRASLRPDAIHSDQHTQLLFAAGMALVFGYFSVSSFLKASRRGRRS